MSEKSAVLGTLQGLPEGATFEEIIDAISILAAIRRGEEAAEAGRVVSQEEVKKRLATWISTSSGPSQP